MRTPGLWLLLLSTSLAAGMHGASFSQERLTGRIKVTDGDSFELGAARVRLFGVDAPEGEQSCTRGGREWRCGAAATAELRRLTGGREVVCTKRDQDEYGRIVAVCRSGTADLGAAMVQAGLALAYRRYSGDYVAAETQARTARRGVWAGEFTPPADWRRAERSDARESRAAETAGAEPPRRDGCYIKGNVNSEGVKIYHTPASPAYRATAIDTGNGERWFCTAAEARRAGWRAPRP